jgi:hypothetical protein
MRVVFVDHDVDDRDVLGFGGGAQALRFSQ